MTDQALPTLVVGSVALDSVRTPAGERTDALGGSASYFSLAASLYAPVRLVGVAGSDFPEEHTRRFREHNIDVEGLEIAEGKTFRWEGVYTPDMNDRETLRTDLNVFETFHPALPAAYRQTPCVLLANIDPGLQMEVLDQMDAPKLVALDTMNFWITSKRPALCEVLAKVDLFFINDAEAKQLVDCESVVEAAERIRELGPRAVIVKRGEHGALARIDDEWFALPAYPVRELRDPTGAGDAFAGGVLGYLARNGGTLEGDVLRRGIAHGTAVASFVVEQFGVDGLFELTREDLARRVGEIREMVRLETE